MNKEENWMRCDDCQDGERYLTCSEIPLDKCKSIMNEDGGLECTHSVMDNSDEGGEIPKGPYLEDCGGCIILPALDPKDGLVLECTECPDDKGFFHIAQMPHDPKNPCPEVLNKDGKIFCATTYKKGLEDLTPRNEDVDNRANLETTANVDMIEAELAKRLAERAAETENKVEVN